MKSRALRYLGVYTLLLLVLAGFRFFTQNTYAQLFSLQQKERELTHRKTKLEQERARLESNSKIRTWALENGMVPYTSVRQYQEVTPQSQTSTAPAPNKARLEVRTKWR